jgi:D-sedoheptulose 7-phosphate isomerase
MAGDHGAINRRRCGDCKPSENALRPTRSTKNFSWDLLMVADHARQFFSAIGRIAEEIEFAAVERLAAELAALRERGGRLFLLGAGGSAGNCSHAVNDFRKLCNIEAYTPVDNVSELTARTNDEGWETVFAGWLEVSRLGPQDALLVFSVGGGDAERQVSVNLIRAIDLAQQRGAKVFGVVGRASGYTARRADIAIVIPAVEARWVTPLSEAMQAVVWHCLVSHPALQSRQTKW